MDNVTWFALLLGVAGYLAAKSIENLIYFLRSGTTTIEARRDSDLKDIETLIFETRDLACDYWSLPTTSPDKTRISASITGRFTFLASRIALLFGSNSSDTKSIYNYLYLFNIACTGKDFFIGHGAPEPERCENIERFAYAVAYILHVRRRKLPRRIFPRRL